jgi:hypothetical protein
VVIVPIIISQKSDTSATIVEKSEFENEDTLQKYIHEHPEVIPVYEIKRDKRLLVVAREFETQSGPIDALAVDKDGDIYVVETKLYKNNDKRRVVAQVLDYGASLWRHIPDFEAFLSILDRHARHNWGKSFQEKANEFFDLNDEREDSMLSWMRRNLKDGNLKFVVLMDSMDESLKNLITYINQKSQFDIYGVELEFYRHLEYEIGIPKIFGVEVKKDHPHEPTILTKELLLENIRSKNPPDVAQIAEAVIAKLDALGLEAKGTASGVNYGLQADGNFIPFFWLTPMHAWVALPNRAIRSLGDERFLAVKRRINSVGNFYKPGELDDPTKSGALGPKYTIFRNKIDAFAEAIQFVRTQVLVAAGALPEL